MKKQKFLTLVSVLLCLIMFAACAQPAQQPVNPASAPESIGAPEESGSVYTPGTYTGQARGNNGTVTVHVTVTEDAITQIEVEPNTETPSLAKTPLERIPQQVIEYQSLKVDVVTGATFTSLAVTNAISGALEQAGANLSALRNVEIPKADRTGDTEEKSADIVVVGGGGAGLSAALAAAIKGSSVILIEKTASLGGDTILAGGGYNAADAARAVNNPMTPGLLKIAEGLANEEARNDLHASLMKQVRDQLAAYKKSGSETLFDSPEFHAIQTWAAGDYEAKLELVYHLALRAQDSIGYIESLGGVWREKPITYVGALWPRSHEIMDAKSGQGFIDVLIENIETKNYPIEILYETPAYELILDGDKVTGVKAKGKDNTEYVVKANKGVVLATGGFSANVEMREKYNTQWPTLDRTIKTTNVSTITGDGIVMAEAIGAKLIQMNYIQLLVADPQNGNTSGFVGQATGLYVNREGSRFISELSRRDDLCKAILEQTDSLCFFITGGKNANLDENGLNKYGQHIDDLIAMGKVFRADTLEELGELAGINPAELAKTVEEWNEMCRTGVDGQFGRATFEDIVTIFEGPYYASPRQPAVHHTMGGVEVDEECHVLNTNGAIISGLYAAGEVTGGIHGTNRVGANAIPDALANGRVAGENAHDMK